MGVYRFGIFQARVETGELLSRGCRVPLQPLAFEILCALLERPGELVTREELSTRLWGATTRTDTEQGLNMAVKKLRDALEDSALKPRFIETLPRRGYRFIGELETAESPEPPRIAPSVSTAPQARTRRGYVVAGGSAAVLMLVPFLLWISPSPKSSPAASARTTVLVGQFANETGEPELDGVTETALEAELADAPSVSLVSFERLADALQLMRQPVVSRVPPQVAREICLRDPGIGASVSGSVKKLGSGYLLTASLYRGAGTAPVTAHQELAKSRGQLPRAVRALSADIRRHLSEPLSVSPAQQPLEDVSTPSLEVLRLYSDANQLAGDGQFRAAEVLLREAIERDPEFPSAYILLAWEMRNEGKPPSEYTPYAERALALAGKATEREGLFIRASVHHLRGEFDEAASVYEALLQRYPEHTWADNNLVRLYNSLGRTAELRNALTRRMQTRPNDPFTQFRAGYLCFCMPPVNLEEAEQFANRGAGIVSQRADANAWPREDLHLKALASWSRGDVAGAKRYIDDPAFEDSPARVSAYLAFGLAEEAMHLAAAIQEPRDRHYWGIWSAVVKGDMKAASALTPYFEKAVVSDASVSTLLYAGQTATAAKKLEGPLELRNGALVRAVLEGELCARRGQRERAIEILMPAVTALANSDKKERLLGAVTLARALEAQGHTTEAACVLERATAQRGCGGFYSSFLWPRARRELMLLYERLHRDEDADRLRGELVAAWRLADPQFRDSIDRRLAGIRRPGP